MVILNYANINDQDLDYIVDDTPIKQGRVAPGVYIPVKPMDALKNEKGNKTFLLLSWNYKDSFVKRLKEIMPSFRMIVPFPQLKVEEF